MEADTERDLMRRRELRGDLRPDTLHDQFPNLDLTSRGAWESGLADTLSLGLLLRGQRDGEPVHHATTLTIQGDLVLPGTP